ncbi:hypothetical protein J2X08_001011 [Rhizobium rosettiformans]|nr:hypothetical protein [Rhizobium rosettiformans]MDR7063533.1 hypothetical protein [Rhizobium rosettiformans]
MARRCSVCAHDARQAIEQAIIAGSSLRDVAAAHGLNHAALHRHRQNHLTPELQAAAAAPSVSYPRRSLDLNPRPTISVTSPMAATADDGASVTEPMPAQAPTAPVDNYSLACELRDSALGILRRATAAGDEKLGLDAARTAATILDRLARLMPATGAAAAPLHQSEEWLRTRAAIVSALAPYPEARAAVAAALSQLEASP